MTEGIGVGEIWVPLNLKAFNAAFDDRGRQFDIHRHRGIMHGEHAGGGGEAHDQARWFGGLEVIHVIVPPASVDVFLPL